MKKKQITSILAESLYFQVMLYVLGCFLISFRSHLFWILCSTANVVLMAKFVAELRKIFNNSLWVYSILLLNVLILTIIIWLIGFYPISQELQKIAI